MIFFDSYKFGSTGYGLKPYLYSFYEFEETTGNFIDRHSGSEATLSAGAERDPNGLTGAGFKTNELTTTPYIEMDGGPYTGLSGTSKASYPTLTNESSLVFWYKLLQPKAGQRDAENTILIANGDETSTGGFNVTFDFKIASSYPGIGIYIGGQGGLWLGTKVSSALFGVEDVWHMMVICVSESTSGGRILTSFDGSPVVISSGVPMNPPNSIVEPATLRFGCGTTSQYGIKAVYDKFMYFQNYILTNSDVSFLYNSGAGRVYNEI